MSAALHDARPEEDQELCHRGRVRGLARRAPRSRDRALDQDSQEGLGQADGDACAGARRRPVLGLDRRPAKELRRAVLPAALLAPQAEESVEPDQSRQGRAAGPGRAHDAARTAPRRGRAGRRTLGRGLRTDPGREQRDDSARPARRDRRERARAQDVRHAEPPEPLRPRLPHQPHEDARRPQEEDRGARRDAGARRDDRAPEAAREAQTGPGSHADARATAQLRGARLAMRCSAASKALCSSA